MQQATDGGRRGIAAGRRRAGRLLAWTLLAIGSLLTFPSVLPWIIAAWLVIHTAAVLRGRAGWLPMMAAAAIVLIKRVYVPLSLWLLLACMLAVASVQAVATLKAPTGRQRTRLAGLAALWLVWAAAAWDWHRGSRANHRVAALDQRPVVCLGDSLTSLGPTQGGYPEELRKRLSVPVLNIGQPGITSEHALRQLPALTAVRPQAVVVELGGQDFLKGYSRRRTRKNLETIIVAARKTGAEVILFEIPRGFISDGHGGLERELAAKLDLELIGDGAIRRLVLFSPHGPLGWVPRRHLSDDGLHPNADGNEHLARAAAWALVRLYGTGVLKRAGRRQP